LKTDPRADRKAAHTPVDPPAAFSAPLAYGSLRRNAAAPSLKWSTFQFLKLEPFSAPVDSGVAGLANQSDRHTVAPAQASFPRLEPVEWIQSFAYELPDNLTGASRARASVVVLTGPATRHPLLIVVSVEIDPLRTVGLQTLPSRGLSSRGCLIWADDVGI
jgi:hypothetical protein